MIGRTLFRYVLGEMLRTLLVALVWLMMVGLLALFVRARFSKAGALLGMQDCLAMLPWLAPYIFSLVLPPAMLAASCSTFGRLAAENELVAMRASGISGLTTAWAPLFLGAVGTLAMLWLNLEGFRWAAEGLARLEARTEMSPERLTQPGRRLELSTPDGKLVLFFEKHGPDGSKPVSVSRSGGGGAVLQLNARDFDAELHARRSGRGGNRRFISFVFRDVHVSDPFAPDKNYHVKEHRLEDLELPSGMSRGLLGNDSLRASLDDNLARVAALRAELDVRLAEHADRLRLARAEVLAAGGGAGLGVESLSAQRELDSGRSRICGLIDKISDLRAEASRKVAFAFSVLVFALLGVPLGAAARKASKLVSLSLGVVGGAAFYGLWVDAKAISHYGILSPELSPWVPCVIGLVAAGWLTARQNRS